MTFGNVQPLAPGCQSPPRVYCQSPQPIEGLTTPQGLLLRLRKHPHAPRNMVDGQAARQAELRYLDAVSAREADVQELPPLRRTESFAHELRFAALTPSGPRLPTPLRDLSHAAPCPPPARLGGGGWSLLPAPIVKSVPVLEPTRGKAFASKDSETLEVGERCRRELQSEARHRSARLLSHWAESFNHKPRAYAAALKLGLYLLPRLEYPNLKRLHFPANLTLGAGFEDLESLPPRLTVYGNLCLEYLSNFASFGRKLHVHGDLVLTELPKLNHFPACLSCRGGLRLAACLELEAIVENAPTIEIF